MNIVGQDCILRSEFKNLERKRGQAALSTPTLAGEIRSLLEGTE
jgi:hypothetical protein